MDHQFPEPPDVPLPAVKALIEYAERCAHHLSEEHRAASAHGHIPEGDSLSNLNGYRFTALWLRESYLDQPSG